MNNQLWYDAGTPEFRKHNPVCISCSSFSPMSTKNLTAYLRDHAAGAAGALDLVAHLISIYAGSPDAKFFEKLRTQIEDDRATLDGLLSRLRASESTVFNAMSRAGEKIARIKLLLAGPNGEGLGRLEALDALSLGIEGKRALWLALAAVAVPKLQTADFAALARRAAAQRKGVERRRLAVARRVLATGAARQKR